ncbi:hypothetical protein BRADI_4g08625v3 [Brachypodium distachyon]|uniref:Uncharacterized protein n=1 Tax=Brachypodium distachyon TaxID=15368 RepID=A0A2K2CLA8_BRADI|nr:hypothetical protein BRADI_4g08625v3 [Brachypodium distachyon]
MAGQEGRAIAYLARPSLAEQRSGCQQRSSVLERSARGEPSVPTVGTQKRGCPAQAFRRAGGGCGAGEGIGARPPARPKQGRTHFEVAAKTCCLLEERMDPSGPGSGGAVGALGSDGSSAAGRAGGGHGMRCAVAGCGVRGGVDGTVGGRGGGGGGPNMVKRRFRGWMLPPGRHRGVCCVICASMCWRRRDGQAFCVVCWRRRSRAAAAAALSSLPADSFSSPFSVPSGRGDEKI